MSLSVKAEAAGRTLLAPGRAVSSGGCCWSGLAGFGVRAAARRLVLGPRGSRAAEVVGRAVGAHPGRFATRPARPPRARSPAWWSSREFHRRAFVSIAASGSGGANRPRRRLRAELSTCPQPPLFFCSSFQEKKRTAVVVRAVGCGDNRCPRSSSAVDDCGGARGVIGGWAERVVDNSWPARACPQFAHLVHTAVHSCPRSCTQTLRKEPSPPIGVWADLCASCVQPRFGLWAARGWLCTGCGWIGENSSSSLGMPELWTAGDNGPDFC